MPVVVRYVGGHFHILYTESCECLGTPDNPHIFLHKSLFVWISNFISMCHIGDTRNDI